MVYFKGYKIVYDQQYHCYRVYLNKKYCCTRWHYYECKHYIREHKGGENNV